jgi:hypothetical protein
MARLTELLALRYDANRTRHHKRHRRGSESQKNVIRRDRRSKDY